MGVLTNLATAHPERWPGWSRPVVEWSWLIGAAVIVAVGARAVWVRWRLRLPRPEWAGDNPYPGLDAYDGSRARVFFGRTDDVRDLVQRVHGAVSSAQRFVPVVGPSGSGKSSLVLAGLLPALGGRWAVLGPLTPGVSGIDELSQLLGMDVRGSAETVLAAVRDGGPAPSPVSVSHAMREARATRPRLLLVVDQFEEVAIQHTEHERHLFLALLSALVANDQRVRVVVTLRSEWLGQFQQGPGAWLFMVLFMVNALEPRQVREVVEGPADLTDTVFEPGLVEEIVRDTGRGDALPLLSSLLGELYDSLGRDRYLSMTDYAQAGKVGGSIAGRAEAAVAGSTQDLETTLTTLLLFVDLRGEEPTRRLVWDDTLATAQRDVVVAFVRAHLITSDIAPDDRVGFEVAHEALLRQWQPLADHIQTHRGSLRRISELLPLAQAWVKSGRSAGYLVPSRRLAELDTTTAVPLPEPLAEFAAASMRNDEADRRRRADVAGLRALEIVDRDAATAISLSLAACAELIPTPTASTALYRSLGTGLRHILVGHTGQVRCARVAPNGCIATADDAGAIRVWSDDGTLRHVLPGHVAPVSALAFAPDGRLASGDEAGHVALWGADGQMIRRLECSPGSVSSVVFAADGRLAAAGHHTVSLWDVDGEPIRRLTSDGETTAVAFTTDTVLITTGGNGEIRVWGDSGPERQCVHCDDESLVTALAVADNGRIAAGDHNGVVQVWQTDGTRLEVTYRFGAPGRGADPVRHLAFSSTGALTALTADGHITTYTPRSVDTLETSRAGNAITSMAYGLGTLLASTSRSGVSVDSAEGVEVAYLGGTKDAIVLDFTTRGLLVSATASTVNVWDISKRVRPLTPPIDIDQFGHLVESAGGQTTDIPHLAPTGLDGQLPLSDWGDVCAIGPDGRYAVVAEGAVKILDADGALLHPLDGHQRPVARAALLVFAADGRLATAEDDHTVAVWDTDGQLRHILDGHESPLERIGSAPDGRFVTSTTLGAVRIWNTVGELIQTVEKPGEQPVLVRFTFTRGGRLVTASEDVTVRLWDHDGALLRTLTGHTEPVDYLAVVPGGGLATAAQDGTIRLWSEDGEPLRVIDISSHVVFALTVTDAGLVVASCEDGVVRAWTPDGRLLYELPSDDGLPRDVALCSNTRLVTVGRDKFTCWPAVLPVADLIADARRCALPSLTSAARHRWMLPNTP